MATFEIRLFGEFQITRSGEDLSEGISGQSASLFCYLLLNRHRRVHRDTIVGYYWGGFPQTKARKALRTAIWRIRRGLEDDGAPIILADSDYVSVNTRNDYWLDVEEFERLVNLTRNDDHHRSPHEQAVSLRQAVSLHRADLLEGWTDDWVLFERTRLQLLYLRALMSLMSYHDSRQAYDRAIEYGLLILHHDPLLESVHRRLMRLHYRAGNRAAAVRQYERCRAALADELGIEPMEETQYLFEAIRSEKLPTLETRQPGDGDPSSSAGALTGRSLEPVLRRIELVRQHLEAARRDLTSVAAVVGTYAKGGGAVENG